MDKTLKTTSLEKFEIPSEAKETLSFQTKSLDLSGPAGETWVMARWMTGNWIGASITGALSVTPAVVENFVLVPNITGWVTVASLGFFTMISVLFSRESYTGMDSHLRNLRKDISPTEWSSDSSQGKRGFRIHSKSRKNATLELLMPRRIFRRILMNETVWYSPLRDVYTMQKSYLTRGSWIEETKEIPGRRYVFQQAMKSL